MTHELMRQILDESKITYAYYQFKEPVKARRYIAYLEDSKDRFLADDKVYTNDSNFRIELYTKVVEPKTEQMLIDLFEKYEVVWDAGPAVYIDSEKVYQTIFFV